MLISASQMSRYYAKWHNLELEYLLQINLFGPSALPLLRAGARLPHGLLADWGQYGIALQEAEQEESDLHTLVSALHYQVLGNMAAGSGSYILQVFVFLEDVARDGTLVGENNDWVSSMDTTTALRRNLVSLVTLHSAKFHCAMHSSLNKILYNHTTNSEVWNYLFTC